MQAEGINESLVHLAFWSSALTFLLNKKKNIKRSLATIFASLNSSFFWFRTAHTLTDLQKIPKLIFDFVESEDFRFLIFSLFPILGLILCSNNPCDETRMDIDVHFSLLLRGTFWWRSRTRQCLQKENDPRNQIRTRIHRRMVLCRHLWQLETSLLPGIASGKCYGNSHARRRPPDLRVALDPDCQSKLDWFTLCAGLPWQILGFWEY